MPAIAMGLLWVGYTYTLWGYCLIRGYNVTLRQLVDPVHPLVWGNFPTIPQGQLLPKAALTGTTTPGTAPPGPPKPPPLPTGGGGGGGGTKKG